MKRIFFISLVLLYCIALQAKDYVLISEIMYDSPYNEQIVFPPYSNGEFLELYNAGLDTVDLGGWYLKGGGVTEYYYFPDTCRLAPQECLIVAYRHKNTPDWSLDSLFSFSSSQQVLYQRKIILSNGEESVSLWDASGVMKDSVLYDGEDNRRKENRLEAHNADSIPLTTCVSLQRITAACDESACGISDNAHWVTQTVTCGNLPIDFIPPAIDRDYALSTMSSDNYVLSVFPTQSASTVRFTPQEATVNNSEGRIFITHYDGFGREQQRTHYKGTPLGSDWVVLSQYDEDNQLQSQSIPIPVENNNGKCLTFDECLQVPVQAFGHSFVYNSTHKESSPLRRVISTSGPDPDWVNRGQSYTYGVNAANEVKNFTVTPSYTLVCEGYYDKNKLHKTEVLDEDSNSFVQFIDPTGRIVMERRGGENDTYYVYNAKGEVCYILPPLAADHLHQGSFDIHDSILSAYAYAYQYDTRGNNIYKRLPGCEPIYMVYDKTCRLILSQDGNQRRGKINGIEGRTWTVRKYDTLGREVYSTEVVVDVTDSHSSLLSSFRNWQVTEHFSSTSQNYPLEDTGYSRAYYHHHATKVLSVNYYDNYDFLSLLSDSVGEALAYLEVFQGTKQVKKTSGVLTGKRIYSLKYNTYEVTAYYYDERGRLSQERTYSPRHGFSSVSYQYDFVGNVTQRLHQRDDERFTEHYTFTYDKEGRLLTTDYKIGNNPTVRLVSQTYDESGRIKEKYLHNAIDTVRYVYDLRNHLTQIVYKEFEQHIYYARPPKGQACYNGNPSAIAWTYGDNVHAYNFTYDNQDRLLTAEASSGWDMTGEACNQSEHITYDKHGNITMLGRHIDSSTQDELYFQYEGNQLLSVSDEGDDADSYAIKEYLDRHDGERDFTYDCNGNLISDLDRDIVSITYNSLNLPQLISFGNGSFITHDWGADMRCIRTSYHASPESFGVPEGDDVHVLYRNDGVVDIGVIYDGNIQRVNWYDADETIIRSLYYVYNGVGYVTIEGDGTEISAPSYHYNRYDYLGNIREVRSVVSDSVVQRTQYYAFGLPWAGSEGSEAQPRKYNGKEWVEAFGYDNYLYGARDYYSAIGRFTVVDPFAEKYAHISPYAYCANNPIKYVDPDGRENVIALSRNRESTSSIIKAIANFPINTKTIHFWAHGNNQLIETGNLSGDEVTLISNPKAFNSYLKKYSKIWASRKNDEPAIIVLHSCSTGKGKNSIAEQISNFPTFENVIIVAPSKNILIINEKEYGPADKENISDMGVWKVFLNGKLVNTFNGKTIPLFDNPEQHINKYKFSNE